MTTEQRFIKTALHKLGVTQAELADAIGVSQSAISDMLNGQRTIRKYHKLAIKYLLTKGGLV